MKLFSSLSRTVDDFSPLHDVVRIYSCGPTVYNHAHIGNLSAYIFADILRRTFRLAGYSTKHVMNFTDVDDKTIRDSRAKYPDLDSTEALKKLTHYYEKVFLDEIAQVGNDNNAVDFVRATENIVDMQDLIRKLLAEGVAYLAEDGIYFSIAEYQKTRVYGRLSHIEIAADTRSRVDNDEYDKESAQDFALWKAQKDGEPAWDFDVDGKNFAGRPGWHIECSVMSVKNLGQPFDVHTGGVDLIFPHHENEIAQSTAGSQPAQYANFFVHNEHLLVDGKKMSKSAHNFYTLPDILAKDFDALDFRMLVLQSHYRSATNFSWDNLTAARNRRRNWRNVAELRHQTPDSGDDGQTEIVNNLLDEAAAALLNDIDTPNALKFLDQIVDIFTNHIDNLSHFALDNFIKFIDDNLGLDLCNCTSDITSAQYDFIKLRAVARDQKDWAKSDEIRDELLNQGIEIKDTNIGQIWARE
ncbi:cysteine--tRNA ligase [Candidatus Saccharibacteria bacterium]|nr:cysteine--tRNA ligase [Candidatus Saccharibacteria bacterium]MCL1962995.1 cysteine--tRNA ligase [Candidatus Saccharibacteria bacterium]